MTELLPLIVGASLTLLMLHTGITFDASAIHAGLDRARWRQLVFLAGANFIAVPVVTVVAILHLPVRPDVSIVLVVLSVLPCAPLIPALAGFAGEPPEWPLSVFFAFSLISLAMVPVLVGLLSLPAIAGVTAPHWQDLGVAGGKYIVSCYVPLACGAALRLRWPARVLRWQPRLQRLSMVCLIVSMALLLYAHRLDVLAMTSGDFCALLLFELLCLISACVLGKRAGGPFTARFLATVLRNFAMALAFTNVALPGTTAPVYVMVFSSIMVVIALAGILGRRLLPRERA